MKHLPVFALVFLLLACTTTRQRLVGSFRYNDAHRPQIHFSPQKGWMNDPNGMVFHNGVYHLFYQHNPDSTFWGPMHWGHATSTDLVKWSEQPIALYPDSLGTIFSGSAVVDAKNSAGFGKDALVAIFTHHNTELERTGTDKFQYQSLAYSSDNGKTWTKYPGNPVLKNPGIRDFRDPKVMWYEAGNKWIMTLATLDHITFYSSPNLKDWTEESKFGKGIGAHGGVWECPDLFSMNYQGKTVWVLIVNLNPGGPNGGSATQYFTGEFDGKTFKPYQTDTRWLDYGPDEYAGITWNNTGHRKIFMGWMSNWQYANLVPTQQWRSAMTVARDLGIQQIGDKYFLTSKPVPELEKLSEKTFTATKLHVRNYDLAALAGNIKGPAKLQFSTENLKSFRIILSNALNEELLIGYDKESNQYYIDRSRSGKINFEKGFAGRHTAPRIALSLGMDLSLIIDDASVELFADNGLTVMTSIFFPNAPMDQISIQSADGLIIDSLKFTRLKSSW